MFTLSFVQCLGWVFATRRKRRRKCHIFVRTVRGSYTVRVDILSRVLPPSQGGRQIKGFRVSNHQTTKQTRKKEPEVGNGLGRFLGSNVTRVLTIPRLLLVFKVGIRHPRKKERKTRSLHSEFLGVTFLGS